jgi:hypothetical protein
LVPKVAKKAPVRCLCLPSPEESDAMTFDPQRVRAKAQKSSTEDLMDRITVWRDELEPAAVEIIAAELLRRGLGPEAIEAHRQRREADGVYRSDGIAWKCSFCDKPARDRRWSWHRLWGWFPLFPRRFAYCADHDPCDHQAPSNQ